MASTNPQVVGKAFLCLYYPVLYGSPELMYKFYGDSSVVSRPNSNGEMQSVTTPQAINDFILSLDVKNYTTEILSLDSHQSYMGGVLTQVTGYSIGPEKIKRKFCQTFFLAPQAGGGYFVQNDVFRFVDQHEEIPGDIDDVAESGGSADKEVGVNSQVQPSHVDTENAPNIEKGSTIPTPVHVPREPDTSNTPADAPETASERSESSDSSKGDNSIFISNLPPYTIAQEVKVVFERFGKIKAGGIQVRGRNTARCFAFVDFESRESMRAAIRESLVRVQDRLATVKAKIENPTVSRGRDDGGFATDNEQQLPPPRFRSREEYARRDFAAKNKWVPRPQVRNQGWYTRNS